MEDHEEMEEDSTTSNVTMLETRGTFISGTADGTVTEVRHPPKRHRALRFYFSDSFFFFFDSFFLFEFFDV
jgi:hypothetical protein